MDIYQATIVAAFEATDEVSARLIGETLRENAEKDLEDGDEVYVSEVLPISVTRISSEMVSRIRRTRNELISLRKNDCYDVARELDRIAWAIEQHDDECATYDYTSFLEVVKDVLNGGHPI